MKQVLVRPTFHDWCENRLFTHGTSWEGVYRGAFAGWQQRAKAQGIQLNTWDLAPLESCDLLWLLDLPNSKRELEQICCRLRPGTPIVLQIFESPAITSFGFVASNQDRMSAVVTYEHPDDTITSEKRFHYHLPVPVRMPIATPTFSERKGVLMLYSNRVNGLWAVRQSGIAGLPFFGRMLADWDYPLSMLIEISRGDLYPKRRAIAREAEKNAIDFLDIFGSGWHGEKISWCKFYRNPPYRCWRGKTKISKHELCSQYRFVIAFENFQGRRGYISEKIFDALQAGSVPVYLGDEEISKFVPSKAFVDARNFLTMGDLLSYLELCPENEWKAMRQAGQEFLISEAFLPFSDDAFAEQMTHILSSILI